MDELDKIIEQNLKRQNASSKYQKMINDTMKMIENDEIGNKDSNKVVDFKPKKKHKVLRFFQGVAAVLVIGVLGITTYAGVTR